MDHGFDSNLQVNPYHGSSCWSVSLRDKPIRSVEFLATRVSPVRTSSIRTSSVTLNDSKGSLQALLTSTLQSSSLFPFGQRRVGLQKPDVSCIPQNKSERQTLI